jgi:subtilisin family serine protease
MLRGLLAAVALLVLTAGAQSPAQAFDGPQTQIVVTFASPPVAQKGSPARIAAEQRAFERRLVQAVPAAKVRWRYRLVANGMAVAVPRSAVPLVRLLDGVQDLFPSATYRSSLDRSVPQIGAPRLWAPGLQNAGSGMKIAVIDDGVDQTHAFFDPRGYEMPAGFPKGQASFTTAKVIVARAFPPPRASWRYAGRPFDPQHSSHATHVAGIAAGNAGTTASSGRSVSGVAPRAYIGNYKALTIPTDADVGLDGNSPELVAAIEAAVSDGMDVINLSIGEPEIEPSRDIVALALDAASDAGVIPVVAAGNDFGEFGRGSLASPGTSEKAITVGAVTTSEGGGAANVVASFSSSGPTPLSLRLKPEVAAPGVSILSSVPGGWSVLSGTSMAAPHVAGAAALLQQRHPQWTPSQVKSALVATADPAFAGGQTPSPPTRTGAGVVDLASADNPLVFTAPSALSFGLLRPGVGSSGSVQLADAGGGAGTWNAAVELRAGGGTATVAVPAAVQVPGTMGVTVSAVADGEATGLIVLSKGSDRRAVPFWVRVAAPALSAAHTTRLARPGSYRGNTRGRPSLVSTYRYPEVPTGSEVSSSLAGPEQVFRVTLSRAIANFGVVVTSRAQGVRVEPRIVAAGDENRLVGYPALPLNLNPYLQGFGEPVPAAGAVRPAAGTYDVVFDSPGAAGAGAFGFRFWIDDVKPPAAALRARTVRRGAPLVATVKDAGAGVDPGTLEVQVDGQQRAASFRTGAVRIPTRGLPPGRHRLRLQVSDYQESRNMENVPAILPNTRVVATTFVVR